MPHRGVVIVIALGIGVAWIALASILPLPEWFAVLWFDRNAATYPWTIQNLSWLAFWVCAGELWQRYQQAQACTTVLRGKYLPEDDTTVLVQEDMGKVYRQLKTTHNELADIIRSLALRFQAGNAVDETHALLNTRLDL